MHSDAMQDATEKLRRLIQAAGDPSRYRILLALCARERWVSDLATEIALSQSCTTRHLQALESAGVIHTRRAGKRVLAAFAFEDAEVAKLASWLRATAGIDAYAPTAEGNGGTAAARAGSRPGRKPAERRTAGGGAKRGTSRRIEASGGGIVEPAEAVVVTEVDQHPSGEVPPHSSRTGRTRDLDDFLL